MLAPFAGHTRLAEYATLFRSTGEVHETTLAGLRSPQWPNTIHRPTTEIMPIRPIIRYPDPRLALPAQPVTVFDDALRELARDLLETMHDAPGIGITAPHIGIALRVVVLDLDPINGARTYVNDDISRHARVRIRYHDIDGNLQTEESAGLRAVCHQHEIDQLNGLFWIQRLSRLKRERLIKRFEKVLRG